MKISKRWVEQFTDLVIDDDELVRRIGSQLGAIEEVEDWSAYYDDGIIVAEITEAGEHPNADKLGVYTIRISEDGDNRTVVAGDKTLNVGDKVAYIPPGSVVPASIKAGDPFKIDERELRGQLSQGMFGSGKEIIFNGNHKQVAKLDQDAEVGMSLKQAYMLDDLIIDVENKMFTHRPDLFGIIGVAREIAGIQELKFESPEWYRLGAEDVFDQPVENSLPLTIENQVPELCPRFTAVVLDGIKIKDSPLLIQSMLTRVGLKPISNVVDATNSIMYLTAQPSHAFDYDKVKELSSGDPKIVIRLANDEEELDLLDGRTVKLNNNAVVVASDAQAMSIAGSMGGTKSEVDENTTRVILEVANWNMYSIRKTSFAYGLFTDAVTRNNKGQSPDQCRVAANQTIAQLVQTTGARVASQLIDNFPGKSETPAISMSSGFLNTRLGSTYTAQEIADVLARTELVAQVSDNELTITVPFWRTDLLVAEDLVEEVGRLIGFDNLPIELPRRRSSPSSREDMLSLKGRIRSVMAAAGTHEVLTYNFVSGKLLKKAGQSDELIKQAYRIRNSISPELEMMRMSLLPSLLDKVNPNIRQGNKEFTLFEVNKSHNKLEIGEDGLPRERDSLAAVYSAQEGEGAAFYKAKAILVNILDKLGVDAEFKETIESENPWAESIESALEPKRRASVHVKGVVVGYIGEPTTLVSSNFKLAPRCAVFEIDINLLDVQTSGYVSISKFPSSNQDITLEVPDGLAYSELEQLVTGGLQTEGVNISLSPASIYRADAASLRRISFSVKFQSSTKTLKTNEINKIVSSMVSSLSEKSIKQI